MSLSYVLSIAGPTQCEALAIRLQRVPDYSQVAEDFVAPGLLVFISQPHAVKIEITEEEFGFTPTACVSFFVDDETEPASMRTHLLQGCMALLHDNTDEAVLLFNSEEVIFLRRNGKLILNPVEGFWNPEVLAVIPAPYEFEFVRGI